MFYERDGGTYVGATCIRFRIAENSQVIHIGHRSRQLREAEVIFLKAEAKAHNFGLGYVILSLLLCSLGSDFQLFRMDLHAYSVWMLWFNGFSDGPIVRLI